MSKGVFIEGITVDMLRNACLEAVEELLNEGDMVDMEVKPTEWIPVSERLPEDSEDVLITYYCGKELHDPDIVKMVEESPLFNDNIFKIPRIAIAFYIEAYDDGSKAWCSGEGDEIPEGIHVTAWMPLPKPYGEDGEA